MRNDRNIEGKKLKLSKQPTDENIKHVKFAEDLNFDD